MLRFKLVDLYVVTCISWPIQIFQTKGPFQKSVQLASTLLGPDFNFCADKTERVTL